MKFFLLNNVYTDNSWQLSLSINPNTDTCLLYFTIFIYPNNMDNAWQIAFKDANCNASLRLSGLSEEYSDWKTEGRKYIYMLQQAV